WKPAPHPLLSSRLFRRPAGPRTPLSASRFQDRGVRFCQQQKSDDVTRGRKAMSHSRFTRRNVLKSAALGSVAAVAAPYVHGAYAAGTLTLGCWDHWVPGANNTFTKICNEWGAKNKVEVKIDYITSQGEKDKLTAAAEAQAGTGHDIMSHRDWNIRIHERLL